MAKINDSSLFKVREIRSLNGIYKLGTPAMIIDEGSFYRVNGTFIIDKYRIISTSLDGNHLTIHLKDEEIILTVEPK